MELRDKEAIELINSKEMVIIDLFAKWCGPCKTLSPIIDKLAEKYSDKIIVGKINIDENSELTEKYGVQSIPTILLFKNGEMVDKSVGMIGLEKLEEKFINLIN